MRAIKTFDTIPFMSSCKFRNSCHNERPNFLTQWEQSKVFLLKSTILYMPVSLWRFIVNKQILVFVKTLYKPSWRKIFIGVFSYKIQILCGMPEETWRQMQKSTKMWHIWKWQKLSSCPPPQNPFCARALYQYKIGIAGFWNGIPSLFRYRPALEYRPVTDFYGIPAEG